MYYIYEKVIMSDTKETVLLRRAKIIEHLTFDGFIVPVRARLDMSYGIKSYTALREFFVGDEKENIINSVRAEDIKSLNKQILFL